SLDKSWLTLSADYVAADGSTPLTVILELRTADGKHRADLLGDRLQSVVKLDGQPTNPVPILRRAPGLYSFAVQPPAGLGGSSLTLGATFDGEDIVAPKTVPIATDIWSSEYATTPKGGCAAAPGRPAGAGFGVYAFSLLVMALRRRRR